MRSFLYILISSAFVNLVCDALPLPGAYDPYAYEVRDLDEVVRLEARVRRRPVGPGGRYPEDAPGHPDSTRDWHRVPQGTYYQTANHVYSAGDVNAHTGRFMQTLDHATTATSNRQRKSVRTYPKPTSGFRPSEHAHDPTHGHDIRYHYPMSGRPGNAPTNAHTGRTSMRVGTDRLLAWRNRGDRQFHVGVSYHDPHRPIPATSHNHPFSAAAPRRGGTFKVGFTKTKKAITKPFTSLWKKMKGNR